MKKILLSSLLAFSCFLGNAQIANSSSGSISNELLNKVNNMGPQAGSVYDYFSADEIAQIRAYRQIENSMIVNFGGNQYSADGINAVTRAYGWEAFMPAFASFDIATPSTISSVGAGIGSEFAGAINPNDPTQAYSITNTGQFYSVNITTGAYTLVGTINVGSQFNGMAYNPVNNNLYGVTGTGLYLINPTAPSATLVGNLGTTQSLAIALAIDGSGMAYTYDIGDDMLYSVNLATGAATSIGYIGFDSSYAQGMDWDEETNTVYMAAFNFTTFLAEFRSVNLSTGNTTLVGNIGPSSGAEFCWVSFVVEGGGGGPGEDCEVAYPGTYQDGFGYLTLLTVANDFEVAANTVMEVDQVQLRIFGNITSANVSFYQNNGGIPGTQISAPVNVVPTSQTFVINQFGLNLYDVVLDLPSAVMVDGGTTGAIYWVGINTIDGSEGTGNYWEAADVLSNSESYYSEAGGPWTINGFGQDGAFVVRGVCDGEVTPAEGCLDTPNGQWPSTTYTPDCLGIPEPVTSNGWFGEYSMVNVTSGTEYIFSTDVSTAFITIADSAGTTVLASGTGSVTWTATTTGPIRYITHENDECLSSFNFVVRNIQCGEPIVISEPDFPCFFGDGLSSNGPEDGLNVSPATDFRTADDFTVTEEFTVQQVRINVLSVAAITTTTLNFRLDNGGSPGTIEETVTMAPSSSRVVGSGFGYPVHELTFDLATSIVLPAGTYWLEPEVTNAENSGAIYWESSSTGTTGAISHQSLDSGSTWGPNDFGYQQIFFISGQCGDVVVDECDVTYVGTLQDGIGNLQGLQVANDFTVDAQTEMTITKVSMRIFADISTASLYIYEDAAGAPGTMVAPIENITPTSKTFVSNEFGFNVYNVVFDLPTPVSVEGGASETIFWVGLTTMAGTEGGSNFWEAADEYNNAEAMITTDGGTTWLPNGFGQDSAFVVEGECASLGLGDMTSFDFAYYPNPVKDVLTISSQKGVQSVSVFNLAGQQIMNNAKVSNGQINVQSLTAGTYVFRVTLEGGQVETFKIIKK